MDLINSVDFRHKRLNLAPIVLILQFLKPNVVKRYFQDIYFQDIDFQDIDFESANDAVTQG